MPRLVKFGESGNRVYTFSDVVQMRDNFGDMVPRTVRLPGLDGGFDEFGTARAPSEIGNVSATFWIYPTGGSMDAAKDAVRAMADWGVQKLFASQYDGGNQRYVNARVNSIEINENVRDVPHRRLRVRMTWQVAVPFWFSAAGEVPTYGGGVTYGGGAKYGGAGILIDAAGASTEGTVTVAGNATTLGRVTATIPTGASCGDLRVQRIVDSVAVDEWRYDGGLTAGDVLEVNPNTGRVLLNGASAYGVDFTFTHPDWLRLPPGDNLIRVVMGVSDEADVEVRFTERWR
jgi:hypothetical protein